MESQEPLIKDANSQLNVDHRETLSQISQTQKSFVQGAMAERDNLRQDYLDKFGIHFNLPSCDIEKGLVYPKDPTMLVLLINYYNLGTQGDQNRNSYHKQKNKFENQSMAGKRITESMHRQISNLKKSSNKLQSSERQHIRNSAMVFLQEEAQTYKIIYEISFSERISKHASFSPQGDLFVYKMGHGDFIVVDSSNFDKLIELEPFKFVQKSALKDNSSLAILYSNAFSLYDLSDKDDMNPRNQFIKFEECYKQLLDVEFKQEKPQSGTAALQLNLGYNQTQIHLFNFDRTKIVLQLRVFKFENNFLNNRFLFRFSPTMEKAVFCIIPKVEDKKAKERVQTYFLDLQSEFKQEIGGQKQMRAISILQNSNDGTQRPFIGLCADNMGDEIHLLIDDLNYQKINFPFCKEDVSILFFDTRIVQRETMELQIRLGMLVDREKLCVYNYRDINNQGFDGLIGNISRSLSDINYENGQQEGLSYREYEEFQISNFVYPCIAYNYMSQEIRIHFLDNSQQTLTLKIPVQKSWARVNQMKITQDGLYLQFILEDSANIMLFQYDILQKKLSNKDQPLISIQKTSFQLNDHIQDFWCKVTKATNFSKKLMSNEETYDVCLYLLTYPSKVLYHIKIVKNLPTLEIVANEISQILRKNEELFLITQGFQIEQVMQKRLTFQSEVVFQIPEGEILQLISCNNVKRMWMLSKNEMEYFLSEIKLSKEYRFQKVIRTFRVRDKDLIQVMVYQKGYGYIELSKQFNTVVYIANNKMFLLNSIFENEDRKYCISFDEVIQMTSHEDCMLNNYPQVHTLSQKILNVIKTKGGPRLGIVMPSLYSENRVRLRAVDPNVLKNEKAYYSFIRIEDELGDSDDLLFEFNISLKNYSILNVKGQVITKGNSSTEITDVYGQLISMSDNGKVLAFLNEQSNIVNLFEIEIVKNGELNLKKENKINLPSLGLNQMTMRGAMGAIGNLFKQKNLDDSKKKTKVLVNDKKEILLTRQVGELLQFTFYQMTKDEQGQPKQREIYIDYMTYLGDNNDYINTSLSNEQIIIWNRSKMLRIMNSFEVHMVLIWNEQLKTEECSADVNYFSRIIQDNDGNIYVMDNEQGLISLTEASASCKNLSFRHIMQDYLKKRAREILVNQADYYKESVASFYKKGTIGYKVALQDCSNYLVSKKPKIKGIKYLVLRRQVILPYSYLQLIIRNSLQNIQIEGKEQGVDYFLGYRQYADLVPIKVFQWQINNQTLLHEQANYDREIEHFLNLFRKKDDSMVDMLMTMDQDQNTPLHIAYNQGNTKSINTIMQYMAEGCSETLGKYTKIYMKEFEDFINYSSFKQFLEAAFYQSDQFKQIKSLKVENQSKLEDTGILLKQETIVKDRHFVKKLYKRDNAMERNVNVNCIRSDWIFLSDDGLKFLTALSETNDIEYFDLKFTQTIINYLWNIYKNYIIKRLFIPFIVYFLIFVFAITFVYFNSDSFIAKNAFLDYAIYGLLLPMNLYFFLIEVIQLINQGPKKYLNSGWNLIDTITVVLAFIIICIMLYTGSGERHTTINVVGAFLVIALYLKFFYFLRIFNRTAYLIRIITQITDDVKYFLLIFLIALVGFGNGFLILSRGNLDPDQQYVKSFTESIFYTYRMTLGDFDTDEFGNVNVDFSRFVFILATLLVMIILFNLLIAIMGDTYVQIRESEKQQTMKEQLQLIMDNQFLVSTKQLCQGAKYIVSVSLDTEHMLTEAEKAQLRYMQELQEYSDVKFEKVGKETRGIETIITKQIQKLLPTQKMIRHYISSNTKRQRFRRGGQSSRSYESVMEELKESPLRQRMKITPKNVMFKDEQKQ